MTENSDLSLRKKDHLDLASKSQVPQAQNDARFFYEPLLRAHPGPRTSDDGFTFLGRKMRAPLWISSMTGGGQDSRLINENLAQAAREFGLGMGLGSCRSILRETKFFDDFNLRPILGTDRPLYANLGLAQVEVLLRNNNVNVIRDLVGKLAADGLIIHVNPLQEFFQKDGDRIERPPIETIASLLELVEFNVLVKEVGQGMGPQSLQALIKLPLAAVEFAGFGGTNFSQLELSRYKGSRPDGLSPLVFVGHSSQEMIMMTNKINRELGSSAQCRQFIVSGGVRSFLDGYYLINTLEKPAQAIYGQGWRLLQFAKDYNMLRSYIARQIAGYRLAENYLSLRP